MHADTLQIVSASQLMNYTPGKKKPQGLKTRNKDTDIGKVS